MPEYAKRLAAAFWPGPLTIILKKSDIVPKQTTGGLETVAVRMPNHPLALELIREAGGYIAAPSANLSGKPSPTAAKYVMQDMLGRIDVIIAADGTAIGLESTIVDLTGKVPIILRPGYITQEIPVKGNRQLNITLQEDSKSLDEVVVVGYGTQKKVNLTGSVDVITEEVLANRSAPTMSQLIQGASPNLNISMNSLGGEPGAARTWNIRGTGSLAGNQSPLVLVDGVETNIDTVDPESIESISVLKMLRLQRYMVLVRLSGLYW